MANEQPIAGPPGVQIYNNGRHTVARFRGADLAVINYLEIQLYSDNHDPVTQSPLNQTSCLFGLGYHIVRREGIWIVQTSRGTYEFRDGMPLLRSPGRDHEYVVYPIEGILSLRKYGFLRRPPPPAK
jgi:hypothetical protein